MPLDIPAAADDPGPPVADRIVDDAVAWYVRLAAGTPSAETQRDFDRWLAADAEHARAWQRLQGIGQQLRGPRRHVPPPVARSTLARAAAPAPTRRRLLKTGLWLGAGATALAVLQDELPAPAEWARADERTAPGERRSLQLTDGTRLTLNTATAVDIHYTATERRIVLRHGEIQVITGRDGAGRPFEVQTREGTLHPLGTRFTVRRDTTHTAVATRLAVTEGMVQARPFDTVGARVTAGRQVVFTRTTIGPLAPLDDAAQAWLDGVLVAERQPLGDFIAELGRYRSGRLRCADEVAQLRITGTWPLEGPDPTERILASLERQLPVRLQRLTRYWVTVQPR